MSTDIKEPILSALRQYEHSPEVNDKKGFLLTSEGGYFLYGNRFCDIQDYELELVSDTLQFQGQRVQIPLFFSLSPAGLRVETERPCFPTLISLIFHIGMGDDEPLRGILLALGQEVQFSLFSDPTIEALYRLGRKGTCTPSRAASPDETLSQHAQDLRKNDLRALAGLYLKGKSLSGLLGPHSPGEKR